MITLPPEESLDLIRTLRMASYGMLISGPTLHFWFNFISKVFPKKDVLNTFKKMFLGQAVYGPIINCVFFSYNAGLQGNSHMILCKHASIDSNVLSTADFVLMHLYTHKPPIRLDFMFTSCWTSFDETILKMLHYQLQLCCFIC